MKTVIAPAVGIALAIGADPETETISGITAEEAAIGTIEAGEKIPGIGHGDGQMILLT